MGEFCGHHSGLHTAGRFSEVDSFVEFDVLVAFYDTDSTGGNSYKFDAFFFYFSIGVEKVNFFKSFDMIFFFECNSCVGILYSKDFDFFSQTLFRFGISLNPPFASLPPPLSGENLGRTGEKFG